MFQGYKVIALCMTRADDERNFLFIKALSEKIKEQGCKLFIYQTCSDLHWQNKPEAGEKTVFDLMDYDIIDGVIVFSEIINDEELVDELIRRAVEHNKPVISIGKQKPNCTSFMFEYTDGIEKAVKHIIDEHGCRNLCFVAGPKGEPTSERRIKKYKELIKRYNIEEKSDKIYYGDYWIEPAIKVAHELMMKDTLPEAIICANDIMAIAMSDEFKKHGIIVGQDVLMTGLDATWEGLTNNPSITTSGCDMDDVADILLRIIFKSINGGIVKDIYTSKYNLILGESCGCKKVHDPNLGIRLLKEENERNNKKQYTERRFHAVYESMLKGPQIEDVPHELNLMNYDDCSVVLNEYSFRSSNNPMSNTDVVMKYDDNMIEVFRTGADEGLLPRMFSRKDILPDMQSILELDRPIIFSALSFFSRPIGYLVFYPKVEINNYLMLFSYINYFSEAMGSYQLVKYLEHSANKINRMARHDYLTDLYNRNGFYSRLPKLYAKYHTKCYAAISVDMDGMKDINDNYGHEAGDMAIRRVADALLAIKDRRYICGRFGGDEFMICAAVDNEEEAENFRYDIKEYLARINKSSDNGYEISVSIGICVMPEEDFEFERAMRRSDELMYVEKNRKKRHKEAARYK